VREMEGEMRRKGRMDGERDLPKCSSKTDI